MSFEIQARYRGEAAPVVLRTDDSERARTFANALQGNSRYTEVFVIMGTERLTYTEFLRWLELTSGK